MLIIRNLQLTIEPIFKTAAELGVELGFDPETAPKHLLDRLTSEPYKFILRFQPRGLEFEVAADKYFHLYEDQLENKLEPTFHILLDSAGELEGLTPCEKVV